MSTDAEPQLTKFCNACGHEFPKSCFYPRGGGREGVVSECRRCCTERRRRSRLRQRAGVVDAVVRQSARSRPDRLRATVNVAIQRLGGPVRAGELLADGLLAAKEAGLRQVEYKYLRTIITLAQACEGAGGDE